MQRADHGRTLVSSRECLTHQLPRAAGSNYGSPNLCKELHRPISTAHQDRQHHSSSLHKQPRRYTVSAELVTLAKNLWMWCLERNIHITAQHLPGVVNSTADAESRSDYARSTGQTGSYIQQYSGT